MFFLPEGAQAILENPFGRLESAQRIVSEIRIELKIGHDAEPLSVLRTEEDRLLIVLSHFSTADARRSTRGPSEVRPGGPLRLL